MTQKLDNQRHTVDLQVSFLTIFQIIKPGKDSIQWHLKNLFQIVQKCWISRVQNDVHDLRSRVVICKYFQSDSFQGAIKALHHLKTVAFIEGWHSLAFVMRSHCNMWSPMIEQCSICIALHYGASTWRFLYSKESGASCTCRKSMRNSIHGSIERQSWIKTQ